MVGCLKYGLSGNVRCVHASRMESLVCQGYALAKHPPTDVTPAMQKTVDNWSVPCGAKVTGLLRA